MLLGGFFGLLLGNQLNDSLSFWFADFFSLKLAFLHMGDFSDLLPGNQLNDSSRILFFKTRLLMGGFFDLLLGNQ
jgi:hypothetical protein